ncbi:HlyD family secretion protein [Rosistilla ulvae]|uniref:HlyD family secretion protein n=1 Tax=Rosistilla ulvae TaxID=1930277 RepID=A0A517LXN6_9BACT|nr:efflux RND transporter periplasmic adaptor subunit [Rosistilla ulvae]QDS87386.1 HlyD family secretion protein [Rosistilla ulvae]
MAVNQETVEQTKNQIRGLVNEIAALSKSGAPAEEYYPQLLQRVISALAAVGGAIWLFDEDRQLKLEYQINTSQTLLEEDSDDANKHNRLLRRVAGAGQQLLVPPYSGTTDGDAEGNPTRFLLVLSPLRSEHQVEGLIEVFQRPDSPPETQKGYLRFLGQMSELAGDWLKGQQLRLFSDRQVLWHQADGFARAAHESLDLKETAYVIANEGRRMIGCDRVSVAIMRGRKCKVLAISGQDTIENRSNIVSSLNNLATRVVAAGEPLWHDGSTEDLPPQIEEAVEDYVDQSYGRHIAVLPLREPSRGNDDALNKNVGEIERDNAHRGDVIGALIVEQIESNLPDEVFRSRVNLVYEHGTRAIANSMQHNNLFLMPVWRTLGKAAWIIKARTLPKTIAVVALLTAAILGMIFVPLDFTLDCPGTLQPTVRQEVFAPIDGEIIEVAAVHGMNVTKGQLLVKLRNRQVEEDYADTMGRIRTAQASLTRIRYELDDVRNSRTGEEQEETRLKGEEAEKRTELDSLLRKQQLLDERLAQLTITAPIDGQIVTWDVEKTLRSRPVVTGQVLLTVADLSKPMHLKLKMPEKKMDHLDRAVVAADGEPLPVTFILATDPDHEMKALLTSRELRAEPDKEEGNVVTLRAEPIDLTTLQPRPGAKVTADVYCGRRAAGFVWFHGAYEWLQTILFKWF